MLGFDSFTFYIGRDLQYFIISCLAVPIVFAILIDIGALFHILVASPIKEVSDLGSFRFSFVTLLVVLDSFPSVLFPMCRGYDGRFDAFHISVNLICACSWFTESIFCLSSIEEMLTLSLILTFCRVLSKLFCANWRLSMSFVRICSPVVLTFP